MKIWSTACFLLTFCFLIPSVDAQISLRQQMKATAHTTDLPTNKKLTEAEVAERQRIAEQRAEERRASAQRIESVITDKPEARARRVMSAFEPAQPVAEARKVTRDKPEPIVRLQFPQLEPRKTKVSTAKPKSEDSPSLLSGAAVPSRAQQQTDRSVSLRGVSRLSSGSGSAETSEADAESGEKKTSSGGLKLKGMVLSGQTMELKDLPNE